MRFMNLLNNSAPIRVDRQVLNASPHPLAQYFLLLLIAMLKELLDHIVAEEV